MLKVTAVLLSALVLGACAPTDMTGPRPGPTLAASSSQHDVGGTPNSNATLTTGVACVVNPFTCATQFANWNLTVNDHGDSFTDDYNGPNGDHVIIKAIWIIPNVWYQVVDEKGRIDGVKLEELVVTPHGLGQAHHP